MTRNDILELKTREKIYSIIKEKPGICVRELQRETGLAIGQLSYHLSLILKADIIKEILNKRFRRFYLININENEARILFLIRRKNVRHIIKLLIIKNKITNSELSKKIKVSPQTITWYIHSLENFNLLNKEAKGNRIFYSLKERHEIQNVMEKYKEAF
ncbi:MAG TPA: winged helix-turn-helix transcriptional regulator [Candidatus Nanoarchaeia archaeon]|nr:winged helix-turn-helix transcriptional regulator [Candidatus Woesearchaeota archaeon]HLC55942.1 winged helix-turn-helix transcriptional regulator [Candidatus Nanoarchaeia archaeon]